MAVAWFPDSPPFPGAPAWQRSVNSGGLYINYPGGNIAEPINAPAETVRFRRQITVPPGVTEDFLRLVITGDIWDTDNNQPARVYIDGVFHNFILPLPGGPSMIPMSLLPSGPHDIEIRMGATGPNAGVVRLDVVTASLITSPEPCNCGSPTWVPAVANAFTGWTAAPETNHVSATSGTPTFTVNGPVRGIRFRMPERGAQSSPEGDGAVLFTISTSETGVIPTVGWAPAIPAFPATAAGPFSIVLSGTTVTYQYDARLGQVSAATFRTAKQNANNAGSPEFQWATFTFSQPVTNILVTGSAFTGAGPLPREGVGQLQVLTDSPPCNCCPFAEQQQRCYRTEELQALFNSPPVVITNGGAGNAVTGLLSRWVDQDITGANFTGWTSPGIQWTEYTSPIIQFTFPTPIDRLTRIQEYNQGGGDLGDSDGFGSAVVDFFDPSGALLATHTFTMGNGAAPFSLTLPTPLYNVSRIVWRNIRKLNPGATVAPLVREFQAFYEPVRIAQAQICNGTVTWFDSVTGDQVDPDNFVTCPPIP